MKKILTVLGARPQFIKAAMLSHEFYKSDITEVMVHTGQHYDDNMSDIFFRELGIKPPAHFLGVNGGGHGSMTGRMMDKLENIMTTEKPNLVLVYGDTNSTLAASLVARKLGIKIAHVEGGLRSHDMSIPEEVNRVLTDRVSNYVICPTQLAVDNLKKEGFDHFPCQVFLTGDLMADTFFKAGAQAPVQTLIPAGQPFAFCTIHRASNTQPQILRRIMDGLNQIAEKTPIVFPIHPRTQAVLTNEKINLSKNIHAMKPTGYLESISFLKACQFAITDSGGLQREAYLAKKKSILIMNYTPWEELVQGGYSVLVDGTKDSMTQGVDQMHRNQPNWSTQFYGDGQASQQIFWILKKALAET